MKDVHTTKEPRDGEEEYAELDLRNFTQRGLGMIGRERHHITLRCINPLLDTTIGRFGTKSAHYSQADVKHFTVMTEAEPSKQFFSWFCGFGNKVKIMEPEIVKQFTAFLYKIGEMYEKD